MIGKQARIFLKHKLIFYTSRESCCESVKYIASEGDEGISRGFGTKIHARTVAMYLPFVEPGKKHRELDTRINGRLARGKRSPGAINGRSLQP